MTHNPLDVAHGVAATQGRSYYGTALQKSCILARLLRGPASRQELERRCGAPSVTKRISELRRDGFNITSGWAPMAGPGGLISVQTVYALVEIDSRQADLFHASEAGAGGRP